MDGHLEELMDQERRHQIIKVTSSGSWRSFKALLLSLTLVVVSGMNTTFRGQDGVSSQPDARI
jgi:hypothetical protein